MPFVLPTFNVSVGIWTAPWATRVLRITVDANMSPGRRSYQLQNTALGDSYGITPFLLLPKGTDIRDSSTSGAQFPPLSDYVEAPAGSGRWYRVAMVDDVAKGFGNEYRVATINKVYQGVDGGGTFTGVFWPTPIP